MRRFLPPVDETALAELEARLGSRLPPVIRSFYSELCGGEEDRGYLGILTLERALPNAARLTLPIGPDREARVLFPVRERDDGPFEAVVCEGPLSDTIWLLDGSRVSAMPGVDGQPRHALDWLRATLEESARGMPAPIDGAATQVNLAGLDLDAAPAELADATSAMSVSLAGFMHARIDFAAEDYVEVADSVRVQRFFKGPTGKTERAINGRGGITSRELDPQGNITKHVDANGASWLDRYDELGHVVYAVDGEDRPIRFNRDDEGRLVRAEDGAGRVFEYGRDAHGHIEWARTPRGGMTRHRYDQRGLEIETVDPEGRRTRRERDAQGNVVRVIHPNGGTTAFAYDFWGRLTSETLPDGRSYRYRYSPSGLLIETLDGVGRTRQISYDALGNILHEREPDGTGTTYQMGGLGWLASTRSALGTEVRGLYNREGWLVEIENERGERTINEYNATGVIVRQRSFDGREVRFLRDARDYIVGVVDDLGKTAIMRNKVGQVLGIVGPDGARREFEYDGRGALVGTRAPGTSMTWSRDADGEVERETVTVGGTAHQVETTRDLLGRRLLTKTSAGHAVEVRRGALSSEDSGRVVRRSGPAVRRARGAHARAISARSWSQSPSIAWSAATSCSVRPASKVARGTKENARSEGVWTKHKLAVSERMLNPTTDRAMCSSHTRRSSNAIRCHSERSNHDSRIGTP